MSKRVEAVKNYLLRGWVPFLYSTNEIPPSEWQNSTQDRLHLDTVEHTTSPIAILLGEPSGIVVIDIDVHNGGSLDALIERYGEEVGNTYRVRTPSLGFHLYYKIPDGVSLPGIINMGRHVPELGPGLDFLGDSRHVKAPPSTRVGVKGKRDGEYVVAPHSPSEPAELPPEILRDWQSALVPKRASQGTSVASVEAIPTHLQPKRVELHRFLVREACEEPEGNRNNVLSRNLGISLRLALAMPEDVLSTEGVGEDYSNAPEASETNYWGMFQRSLDYASNNPWEEDEFDSIPFPEGLSAEDQMEIYRELRRQERRAVATGIMKERELDRRANEIELPTYRKLGDFLDEHEEDGMWIVDDLMQKEGRVLLSAPYKVGKSTLMLQLMNCLTNGRKFLDRYEVPNAMNVVYWDLELGSAQARKWLRDVKSIDPSKLTYVNMHGQGNAADMRSDRHRNQTARQLRDVGAEILVIDPLSPIISAAGIKEDSSEVRTLLDSFDALMAEAGLKGLIVTAHTGHDKQGRPRGSSAMGDWPTALWNMQKNEANGVRSFAALGRDVDVPRRDLVFDQTLRSYSLDAFQADGPDRYDEYFGRLFGQTNVPQVANDLEVSQPTAKTKLERHGYVVVKVGGRTEAGHREPDTWGPKPVVPDPWSE